MTDKELIETLRIAAGTPDNLAVNIAMRMLLLAAAERIKLLSNEKPI